ncbi:MAG: fructose,6-bisphosphatase [Thermotogota bacterium]|nr:fructose,6-bisphosphatase [Thermotogota bacterium]
MLREITLDLVRVTEAAALVSSLQLGRGDKEAVDRAAVDAMRGMLDYIPMRATVVIGEGEKDKAPMLYIGEKVGTWEADSPEYDIAVDPVDGTRLVAYGLSNAISVLAAAEKGAITYLPTFYSWKLAVGPELAGKLDLNLSITENLRRASEVLGVKISEITVVVLNRDRHRDIIEEIRSAGARIKLISDGDVAAAIATAIPESGVDIYMGIGGSPEAVLAAAALRCLGGEMQLRLWPHSREEKEKVLSDGYDLERIYRTEELVSGEDVVFVATGITSGDFLKGVRYMRDKVITESIAMRARSRTVRKITAYHDVKHKHVPLKSRGGDVSFFELQR